jgi:hypothetical protein
MKRGGQMCDIQKIMQEANEHPHRFMSRESVRENILDLSFSADDAKVLIESIVSVTIEVKKIALLNLYMGLAGHEKTNLLLIYNNLSENVEVCMLCYLGCNECFNKNLLVGDVENQKLMMEVTEKCIINFSAQCGKMSIYLHTMVMHLMEKTLLQYQNKTNILDKLSLNVMAVILMRQMFRNPDLAHVVYTRYHGFRNGQTDENKRFHALYGGELSHLEEFRGQSNADRLQLMEIICRLPSGSDGEISVIPVFLKNKINEILHGISNENTAKTPDTKKNQLAQLTLFIRKTESLGVEGKLRKYNTHLQGLHYRTAEFRSMAEPVEWICGDLNKLHNAVKVVYEQGHELEFFKNLFTNANKEISPEAWVQDGEVMFLWLCACGSKWGKEFHGDMLLKDFKIKDETNVLLMECPKNISDLLKKRMFLLNDDGHPLARYYTLVNFIHRKMISARPAGYGGVFEEAIKSAWNEMQTGNPLDVLNLIFKKFSNVGLEEFGCVRFKTFYLEIILRDCNKHTYTLFIHPLSYDSEAGAGVPGAFLAGTFLGMETDEMPTCTVRQNYHKLTVLDAIRPGVDYELGRVLGNDLRLYAASEVSKVQAETLKKLLPSLENLTDMFNRAQGEAWRIRTVMDPDWSGVFSVEMFRVIEKIFNSQEPIDYHINLEKTSKPYRGKVDIKHSGAENEQQLWSMLKYITSAYLGGRSLACSKNFLRSKKMPVKFLEQKINSDRLFHDNTFLSEYFQCASKICKIEYLEERNRLSLSLSLFLKNISIDVMHSGRGVSNIQVMYLLGISLCSFRHNGQQYRIGSGIDRFYKLCSPNSLKYWKMENGVSVVAFLKALRVLLTSALKYGPENYLKITPEEGNELEISDQLHLTLHCDKVWTHELRNSVWKYISSGQDEYHDLRVSVKTISDAVNCPPEFYDQSNFQIDSRKSKFYFLNRATECEIHIVLTN